MLDARGVMEPWQEPRHGRGWLILLLGITVFAAFGAVVGYAYFKGLPGIGGEPPLIKAQEGPYRHAPSDRGGLAVPNTNSSIVTVLRPQNEPPRVERILPAETSPALESAEPDADIETTAVPPDQPLASLNTPEEDAAATLDPTDPAAAIALPYPRSKPVPPEPVVEAEPIETTISALPQVEPAAPPEEPAPEPQLPEPAPEPAAARARAAARRAATARARAAARRTGARACCRGAARGGGACARPAAAGPRRPGGRGGTGAAAAGKRRGHLPSAARGGPLGRRADPGVGRPAAALSRGTRWGESPGRADRHHLRPPVPPAGRPVHLARIRRQRLRLHPGQRWPVLHRRADRPVRQG